MSAVPAMAAMYGVLLFWTVADNAPTYNVPTSDNVMVNVNLGKIRALGGMQGRRRGGRGGGLEGGGAHFLLALVI